MQKSNIYSTMAVGFGYLVSEDAGAGRHSSLEGRFGISMLSTRVLLLRGASYPLQSGHECRDNPPSSRSLKRNKAVVYRTR